MAKQLDDILCKIGQLRCYQLTALFWNGLVAGFYAFAMLIVIFTQRSDQAFRCKTDENDTLYNDPVYLNTSMATDVCLKGNSTEPCNEFLFDRTQIAETVASQFGLVCDRIVYSTVANIAFIAVNIPGALVCGILTDWLGRKKVITFGLIMSGLSSIILSFSVNIEMYIAFRMMINASALASYLASTMLLMEIVSPNRRVQICILQVLFWPVGVMIMSLIAYVLPNWQHMQIAISIPPLLLGILFIWFVDESPAWLLAKGRVEEAQKLVEKIARVNGQILPQDLVMKDAKLLEDEMSCEVNEAGKETICELLHAKRLMMHVAIVVFARVGVDMSYYGLALGVGNLAGNIYLNNLISGLVEIPAYLLCLVVIYWGRRRVQTFMTLTGGSALIASGFTTLYGEDYVIVIIATNMVGRLCIATGWQILYMWTLELYPTAFRSRLALCSTLFGNVGAIMAPFIIDMGKILGKPNLRSDLIAPFGFGSLLIAGGLMTLLVAETNNRKLPANISKANRRRFSMAMGTAETLASAEVIETASMLLEVKNS